MKPYGYKRKSDYKGDGCFLCTQQRKQSKTVTRGKAKLEIKRELQTPTRRAKTRTG